MFLRPMLLSLFCIFIPLQDLLADEVSPQHIIRNRESCNCLYPDFPSLIKETRSAVVNIGKNKQSRGTGFLIHPSGLVVTNRHIIQGVRSPEVVVEGKTGITAKILTSDSNKDIALLQIQAAEPFPFLEIAKNTEPVIGEWSLVIGNPFGLGVSATVGIISAINITLGSSPVQWIQIDAAVNPGNSGGPLINTNGKVIGMVSSQTTMGQGLGFAVPISEVMQLATPYFPDLYESRP